MRRLHSLDYSFKYLTLGLKNPKRRENTPVIKLSNQYEKFI